MRLVLVQHLGDEPVWHVRCDMPGNYHTLCCLGLDDGAQDEGGDFTGAKIIGAEPKRGQKCGCRQCLEVWSSVIALGLRRSDFDP